MASRRKPFVVIGLTGAFGSECTTVAKYLATKYKFHIISLSKIIKEHARSAGEKLPKNSFELRLRMQEIGNDNRKKTPEFLVNEAIDKTNEMYGKRPGVVIEALRNPAEVNALFSLPYSYVLAVFAPLQKRMSRTGATTKARNDLFEKADKRDSGLTQPKYGQHVPDCVAISDYFIDNSGSKQSLYTQVRKFMDLGYEGRHRKPTVDEVMMSHAFALRLLSPCLKHQVGCVVAKEGHVIGSGWNGPPGKTRACSECLRDILSKCSHCGNPVQLTFAYCTVCGKEVEAAQPLSKHLDLCLAVHAEERAILQAAKLGGMSLQGSIVYSTTFPCMLCAKMICEVGIKKVIYVEAYPSPKAEEVLLDNKVQVERFRGFAARQLYSTYFRER